MLHVRSGRLAHASRETLLRILETLPAALFVLDEQGRVEDVNTHAQKLLKVTAEDVIGQPLVRVLWETDTPAPRELFRTAMARAQANETARFATLLHTRDGLEHDIAVTLTRYTPACGQHGPLFLLTFMLTATRQRPDETIPALIDAIPHFVWVMGADGSARYGNQRWCDYAGKTLEELHGDGWLQLIHPEDRPQVQETWQTAVLTGTLYEAEHRILDGTTGTYRWFLARGLPYTNPEGHIICWIGTCTDIHAQKLAEEQVRISEQHWHALAETLPQLVWTTSVDGWTEYNNQRLIDYTGSTREQLRGYGWSKFVHPDDYEGVLAARTRALTTGTRYEMAYRLREGRTGTYRWFLARAMPVRNDAGQIIKWFGTATDIDEQKKIEEALLQSQARIRALIDSNIIGIISLEVEGEVVVEANEAFLRMTGYTQEEVRQRMLRRVTITPAEQAPLFEQAIQEVRQRGQHASFETEIVCKDGSRLPVLLGGVTFQDHPHRLISFLLDNSARKELEQRKDDFISMASHELRNPLTALKLQTALVQRQLAKADMLAQVPALATMAVQIDKVTRLVDELLDVSKIQAGRLEYRQEAVELDPLLQEVADTVQQTSPQHTVRLHGATHSRLLADRDRLGQVFTNLLSNAVKYSPHAQTIEIDLSSTSSTATVKVRDYGLGIAHEQREHIFDRFYRGTDAKQQAIPGLGMGLYIVAEIVRHHGGTITVESTVGQGSTFIVTLPNAHAR